MSEIEFSFEIQPDKVTKIDISQWIEHWLTRATHKVRNDAVRKAPYQTGHLKRSLTPVIRWKKGIVWTNVIYAAIHEFWWTIRPKNRENLIFQVNGKWVQTDKVEMPERPYLRPAFSRNERFIKDVISQEIDLDIEKQL